MVADLSYASLLIISGDCCFRNMNSICFIIKLLHDLRAVCKSNLCEPFLLNRIANVSKITPPQSLREVNIYA
jgi:hypothetical protein